MRKFKNKVDISGENEFPMILAKYLSKAGMASRRKSAEIIKTGEIAVNGHTVLEPGFKVTGSDKIFFGNERVVIDKKYYLIMNKPRGYTCTASDPYAKKIVFDLIDIPAVRLFTVGRLDKDSEGMLLITNDGDYGNRITHPRYEIRKNYQVTTDKPLTKNMISQLCSGINDEGEMLKVMAIKVISEKKYQFTMKEGKKREIRRLVNAVKRKTTRLQRIAIGGLFMKDLKPGEWRFLTDEEISLTLGT